MKILIDTDWINFIQDLPSEKQSEILLAIMDYPNRKCDLNCWKKIIEPCLEKGRIGYFNRLQNLKQNRTKSESVTESVTVSDTVSEPTLFRTDDIDIDKDKDIDLNLNNNIDSIKKKFEEFWKIYTPVECDGKTVDKGSKHKSLEKYIKILKSGVNHEDIIAGTKAYIQHCKSNNQFTCGVPVFLNQQRWTDDYNIQAVSSERSRGQRSEPASLLTPYARLAAKYQQEDNLF